MNSTLDNYGGSTNPSFGKVAIDNAAYSIGFSFIVLVLLIIVSFISYKCNRSRSSSSAAAANPINSSDHSNADSIVIHSRGGGSSGLDEATLGHYPKFLYSKAKPLIRADLIASGCSICLGDYKDTDMLRLLPECGHLFHLKCIDPWLKLHPTCPICRSSPLTTPLAEVVTLPILPN